MDENNDSWDDLSYFDDAEGEPTYTDEKGNPTDDSQTVLNELNGDFDESTDDTGDSDSSTDSNDKADTEVVEEKADTPNTVAVEAPVEEKTEVTPESKANDVDSQVAGLQATSAAQNDKDIDLSWLDTEHNPFTEMAKENAKSGNELAYTGSDYRSALARGDEPKAHEIQSDIAAHGETSVPGISYSSEQQALQDIEEGATPNTAGWTAEQIEDLALAAVGQGRGTPESIESAIGNDAMRAAGMNAEDIANLHDTLTTRSDLREADTTRDVMSHIEDGSISVGTLDYHNAGIFFDGLDERHTPDEVRDYLDDYANAHPEVTEAQLSSLASRANLDDYSSPSARAAEEARRVEAARRAEESRRAREEAARRAEESRRAREEEERRRLSDSESDDTGDTATTTTETEESEPTTDTTEAPDTSTETVTEDDIDSAELPTDEDGVVVTDDGEPVTDSEGNPLTIEDEAPIIDNDPGDGSDGESTEEAPDGYHGEQSRDDVGVARTFFGNDYMNSLIENDNGVGFEVAVMLANTLNNFSGGFAGKAVENVKAAVEAIKNGETWAATKAIAKALIASGLSLGMNAGKGLIAILGTIKDIYDCVRNVSKYGKGTGYNPSSLKDKIDDLDDESLGIDEDMTTDVTNNGAGLSANGYSMSSKDNATKESDWNEGLVQDTNNVVSDWCKKVIMYTPYVRNAVTKW